MLSLRYVFPWLLIVQPIRTAAQQIVEIPNGYSCKACRLSIERVAVLKARSVRAEPLPGARVARDGRGRYFVAPTIEPGQVAVFSPDGTHLQSIGRVGDGPGEMEEIGYLQAGRGDSLIVAHHFLRISIFTPQLAFARGFTLQRRSFAPGPFLVRSDGLLALRYGTGGGDDYPMRLIDAQGHLATGFGKLQPYATEGSRDYAALAATREQIWAATFHSYELDLFDSAGRLHRTHRRVTPWFPRLNLKQKTRAGWYAPRIESIALYRDTVWILSSATQPETRPRSRPSASAVEEEASPRRLSVAEMSALRQYYLEAFDPRTNRMIARASLANRLPGGFLEGGQLYTYEEDADGAVSITIWQLSVRRS